jgi:Family of unknown function (DUF6644)
MNSIYPFFKWVNGSWVGQTISDSRWLFPAIEGVHIVALTLLFGAVIVLNLRMAGIVMRSRSLPQIARELAPWTLCSLIIILASGVLLFASEAIRSFHSDPFRIKMVLLLAAIVFHYSISWRLARKEDGHLPSAVRKMAATIGIVLWVSVGFAGRAIGFF